MTFHATTAGVPRIGPDRELKKALEAYWRDSATGRDLAGTATRLVNSPTAWRASTPLPSKVAPAAYPRHPHDPRRTAGRVAESATTEQRPPQFIDLFAAARGTAGCHLHDQVVRHQLPLHRQGCHDRSSASRTAPGSTTSATRSTATATRSARSSSPVTTWRWPAPPRLQPLEHRSPSSRPSAPARIMLRRHLAAARRALPGHRRLPPPLRVRLAELPGRSAWPGLLVGRTTATPRPSRPSAAWDPDASA